jgi:hypothetical protein
MRTFFYACLTAFLVLAVLVFAVLLVVGSMSLFIFTVQYHPVLAVLGICGLFIVGSGLSAVWEEHRQSKKYYGEYK